MVESRAGEGNGGKGCDSRLTSRAAAREPGLLISSGITAGSKVSTESLPLVSSRSEGSLVPEPVRLCPTESPRDRPDISGGLNAWDPSSSGLSSGGGGRGAGGRDAVGNGAGGGSDDDARGRPT